MSPYDPGPGNASEMIQALFHAHRRPCVVTVGTFDGVHDGHCALVARARRLARDRRMALTALTFSPRPDRLFRGDAALADLCPLDERARRLRAAGADDVVVVPFSRAVAAIGAADFAELLRIDLGMVALCVGEDFALGRGRAGSVDALRALGYEVVTAPTVVGPEGAKVSSSFLRAVAAGAAAA